MQAKLLARAMEIVGGRIQLLARLGATEHALSFWLAGRAVIPLAVFLKVVDIVLEDDLARKAQDRRTRPRPMAAANEDDPGASSAAK